MRKSRRTRFVVIVGVALSLSIACNQESSEPDVGRSAVVQEGVRPGAHEWCLVADADSALHAMVRTRLSAPDTLVVDDAVPAEAWRRGREVDDLVVWRLKMPRRPLRHPRDDSPIVDITVDGRRLARTDTSAPPTEGSFRVRERVIKVVLAQGIDPRRSVSTISHWLGSRTVRRPCAAAYRQLDGSPRWVDTEIDDEHRPCVFLSPGERLECRRIPVGARGVSIGVALIAESVELVGEGVRFPPRDPQACVSLRAYLGGKQRQLIGEWSLSAGSAAGFVDHEAVLPEDRASGAVLSIEVLPSTTGRAMGPCVAIGTPFFSGAKAASTRVENAILIVLDTLRADAVDADQSPDIAPAMNGLAREGTRFRRAFSSSPWTLPAHVSMFTSRFPTQHGVVEMQARMSDDDPTLAEVLRGGGWSTAAFTDAGYVSPAFGVHRGFDRFHAQRAGAASVIDRAIRFLRTAPRPFFLFLHTYEIHGPYGPPKPQVLGLVRAYDGTLPSDLQPAHLEQRMRDSTLGAPELRYARDLYRAGIRFTDMEIQRLFDALEHAGLWERTAVVVTSDHGEEFHEHGGFGHGKALFQEQLHVPLIVRSPGDFSGGEVVDEPVRIEDIAPTLLDLLGVPVPDGWVGRSLRDRGGARPILAYSKRPAGGEAWSVVVDRWKLISATDEYYRGRAIGGRTQLFDLHDDPLEQAPVDDAARQRQLEQVLLDHRSRFGPIEGTPPGEAALDARALSELEQLGYLEPSDSKADDPTVDPAVDPAVDRAKDRAKDPTDDRPGDGAEWPQFRGPTGDGQAGAAGRLPMNWDRDENVAWCRALPGRGWSSPVLARGTLYLTAAVPQADAAVAGHEAAAGDEVVAGDETAADDEAAEAGILNLSVLAVDAATGEVAWRTDVFELASPMRIHDKNSHASPTPVVRGDRLFVHFGPAGTACLDLTGAVRWKRSDLEYRPMHGPGSSPVVVDDLLVVPCDGARDPFVVALRCDDGSVAWKTPRDTAARRAFSFSTPLAIEVDGRAQVIVPGSDAVFAYEPRTGETIWRLDYPGGFSVIPRPVHALGLVFVVSGFDRPTLYAIDPTGQGNVTATHVRWRLGKGAPLTPSPLVVGNDLYALADSGVLTCVDAMTGVLRWQKRVGGKHSASPVFADGRIYTQAEDGTGIVVEPGAAFRVLAENDLQERTLASYAIGNGAIFIRSETHLRRIQVKKP